MTIQELVEKIKHIPFELQADSTIRAIANPGYEAKVRVCPITAYCLVTKGKYYNMGDWQNAAAWADVPYDLAKRIITAADAIGLYREEIRQTREALEGLIPASPEEGA